MRAAFAERFGLSESEFATMAGAVHSRIDLSIERVLARDSATE